MANIELAATPLATDGSLKGYWKGEGVNDSSPSAYNLTNNGTTTFTAGKFNNAVTLNGTSQWLSITNAAAPNLYTIGNQTIVGWVKPESYSAARSIYSNSNSSVNTGFSIETDTTTGKLNFRSFKSGDDQSVISSGGITISTLTFIAVSYTSVGQAVTLYVNTTKTTGTFSRALVATTGDTAIGRLGSVAGGQYFNGQVDDLAFQSCIN